MQICPVRGQLTHNWIHAVGLAHDSSDPGARHVHGERSKGLAVDTKLRI